jgi:hypothetical protein
MLDEPAFLVLRFIKIYPIKLDAEVQYCLLVRQAGRASEVGCQPTQKVSMPLFDFWSLPSRVNDARITKQSIMEMFYETLY